MAYTKNRTQLHVSSVETLASHGIAPPDEWTRLRRDYGQLLAMETPCRDRLVDELLSPTGADLGALRALAFSDAASVYQGVRGDVLQVVDNHVANRMVEVYDEVATKNYGAVSRKFNQLANEFVDLTKVVDVDGAADAVMGVGEKQRRAWLAAESIAGELSEWADVLLAAAHLNNINPEDDCDTVAIPLCVKNCEQLHRRKLWSAWEMSGTRTGRWGPLIAVGADIKAHPDPQKIAAYRRPVPMAVRWPIDPATGGRRQEAFDLEDAPASLLDRVKAAVGVGSPADADDWSLGD